MFLLFMYYCFVSTCLCFGDNVSFGTMQLFFQYQPFIGISDFTVPAQHSVIPDISKTTDPAPCHHCINDFIHIGPLALLNLCKRDTQIQKRSKKKRPEAEVYPTDNPFSCFHLVKTQNRDASTLSQRPRRHYRQRVIYTSHRIITHCTIFLRVNRILAGNGKIMPPNTRERDKQITALLYC